MDKELFDYVAERAKVLAKTSDSKQETKDAAQAWLNATSNADAVTADAATERFLDYLDGRPNSVDSLIAFAQGPAVAVMGEEAAAGLLAQAREHKVKGGKYCTCQACTAASEILAKFGRIEL